MSKEWIVYIIQKGNLLYTGITTDLRNRLRQHGVSKALHVERFPTKQEAATIKGWRRKKKLALIHGKSPK